MKKCLLDVSLVIFLLLSAGCTSEEAKVQEVALQAAKDTFQQEVREDIAKGVTGKKNLQQTAAHVLLGKSDFEVQKVDIQGESALAVVQVLTVPLKARQALIEIMGRLDEKKERNFNVSDALQMILRQMELSETRSLQVYKIRLEKAGGWRAVKEAKNGNEK